MTNPSNAVGTNAAYAGRTSANAFNDDLAPYSRGVLSGWGCTPSSGLTVALGGDGSTRDVAVAEDNAGNKTTINNISGAPVEVTLSAAPGANSRIDAIVAYVDNPPQGSATIADNYEACGLIPVSGTAAASPTAPTDSQIRSAITADGASGTTAYYVVLATITIPAGTTDITTDNIVNGAFATLSSDNIDYATLGMNYSLEEQDTGATWVNGKPIYKKTIYISALPNTTTREYSHNISNMEDVIDIQGTMKTGTGSAWPLPQTVNPLASGIAVAIRLRVTESKIVIEAGADRSTYSAYVTLLYTKTA